MNGKAAQNGRKLGGHVPWNTDAMTHDLTIAAAMAAQDCAAA